MDDYKGEDSVCTVQDTSLDYSEDCYDLYITIVETYYCTTSIHISVDLYETYEYKECGKEDSGDPCDYYSTAYNEEECYGAPEDCNGDPYGFAYYASCGCIGGNTGIDECPVEEEETPPEDISIQGEVEKNGNPYIPKPDDKKIPNVLTTMTPQLANTCVTSSLEYISNVLGQPIQEGVFAL
ncbi:hypothetical protein, partial [Flavobacterium pokkalii]